MGKKDGKTAVGLDGVVVAETKLSEVDGEGGRLTIRGYDVESLASHIPFEDMVELLATGAIGNGTLKARIATDRLWAFGRIPRLGEALDRPDGMDALRAAVAQLDGGEDEGLPQPERLVASIPVFAAAWHRRRQGQEAVCPDSTLSHAADYLRMVTGSTPETAKVDALNSYLVTVADHGMNASTFAARVVASTASDDVSAIVAGIGALKGPLHGGAPGPVLDMLDAIGTPDRAAEWIETELRAGSRIMGMGHRIYRVRDPRAAVLERALERLSAAGGHATPRLALARAVERAALGALRERYPDRSLKTNVEFYTAVLLDAIGLPKALFSPTFAVARVAGWIAHISEQKMTGRLIRPESLYIGPRGLDIRVDLHVAKKRMP